MHGRSRREEDDAKTDGAQTGTADHKDKLRQAGMILFGAENVELVYRSGPGIRPRETME
jgi:hypothetical protein